VQERKEVGRMYETQIWTCQGPPILEYKTILCRQHKVEQIKEQMGWLLETQGFKVIAT
jgi:hypothetical protein